MPASDYLSPALRGFLSKLRDFEGEYPYMYLDKVGKVTVGVGHNLTDDFIHLRNTSFTVKRLERCHVAGGDKGIPIASPSRLNLPATYEEVLNDYNFLKAHAGLKKYGASQLGKYTTLELSVRESDRLFEKDCKDAVVKCRTEFGTAFDTFPVSCQAALVDIAYNRGNLHNFRPNFIPAIKGLHGYAGKPMSERWKVAAENSWRRIDLKRDATIKHWLLQGAAECEAAERTL